MPRLALAVDLGGTKIEAALVDEGGQVVVGSRVRAATGAAASRADLQDAVGTVVDGALAALPAAGELRGAGIGSAGPVDLVAGTVSPKNLPVLAGFDLRREVEVRLQALPVRLRLDGTCIALAEHWLGATAGLADTMSMVVSTGVGGGLIVGGALVSGRTGNAGHVGQIHVVSGTGTVPASATTASTGLAFTGSTSTTALALAALASVIAGAVALRAARRRRLASTTTSVVERGDAS
jgi:glucokinase